MFELVGGKADETVVKGLAADIAKFPPNFKGLTYCLLWERPEDRARCTPEPLP